MTSPTQRPAPGMPDDGPAPTEEKAPEAPRLSLTQIVASALAAVSTTVLMSYFGIAGTIIGAGAASVVTVLANYAYTRSIQKTHEQLKPVVHQLVQVGGSPTRPRGATAKLPAVTRGEDTQPLARARDAAATDTTTAVVRGTVDDAAGETRADQTGAVPAGPDAVVGAVDAVPRGDDDAPAVDEEARPGPWFRLIDRYGKGKVLTVSAVALFVVVMGVVLVVELALGKPLADAVRGQEGSGTSISRTTTSDVGPQDVTPTHDDPSDGGTAPTDAPTTAPSDVPTTDPTAPATEEPTDQPTDDPTSTPTPTPEPTDPVTPGDGTGGTAPGTGSGSGETETGGASSDGTGLDGTGTAGEAEPAPAPAPSTTPGA